MTFGSGEGEWGVPICPLASLALRSFSASDSVQACCPLQVRRGMAAGYPARPIQALLHPSLLSYLMNSFPPSFLQFFCASLTGTIGLPDESTVYTPTTLLLSLPHPSSPCLCASVTPLSSFQNQQKWLVKREATHPIFLALASLRERHVG